MVVHKPPMGYNTWNYFGEDINEELLYELADALVDSGLRDIGYNYLVIDDCWQERTRDENGRLVPNKERFPNGIKPICDYCHSKGLKFGMYSDLGALTCAGYPGSYGFEYIDAQTFADWGVDFLKYDYCFRSKSVDPATLYRKMGIALKSTGKDILYSICSWGRDETDKWVDTTSGSMWRLGGDIKDDWQHIRNMAVAYVVTNGKSYMNCFTDLDMLVVGMKNRGYCAITGCTFEEYRTHFSFWAFVGAPLMIGCDIRDLEDDTKQILTNKDLIEINQDAEYNRAWLLHASDGITDENEHPCYARILENGDIALGFFNFSDTKIASRYITLDMLGLDADVPVDITIKDVWSGEIVNQKEDYWESCATANNIIFIGSIEPHDCVVYRISVKNK